MSVENSSGQIILKTWSVLTAEQHSETFSDVHLLDIFFKRFIFIFFVYGCFAFMNVAVARAQPLICLSNSQNILPPLQYFFIFSSVSFFAITFKFSFYLC